MIQVKTPKAVLSYLKYQDKSGHLSASKPCSKLVLAICVIMVMVCYYYFYFMC